MSSTSLTVLVESPLFGSNGVVVDPGPAHSTLGTRQVMFAEGVFGLPLPCWSPGSGRMIGAYSERL